MKGFDSTYKRSPRVFSVGAGIALVAALYAGGATATPAASVSSANVQTAESVDALALKWFAQMETGQIDRAQLTADYSARLTNDAVREMSQYLKQHDYGVPRGDAASLLFGFNSGGKITGISLLSMAGD
jgi:hypothetical protein